MCERPRVSFSRAYIGFMRATCALCACSRYSRTARCAVDRGKNGRKENWRIAFRGHERCLTKDTASATGIRIKKSSYRSTIVQST